MKPRRPPLPDDAVVLVTGASSGLGLALAQKLLRTNHRLILTARHASLSRFAEAGIYESERLWIRSLDITNADERVAVVAEAARRWGGVDVLVNNAGIAYRAVVEHITDDGRDDQMDINFHAPLDLIRLVLPQMRAKHFGRIVNVSSVGGMMAMPTMALYSASKFALEGASEALWYEVRPWGISVSLVEPGFIHSRSFENTRYTGPSRWSAEHSDEPYHRHYEHMTRMIDQLMNGTWAGHGQVADVILRTFRQTEPALRIPATPDAHFFALLRRFLPRRWYHRLLYAWLPHIACWGQASETLEETTVKQSAEV